MTAIGMAVRTARHSRGITLKNLSRQSGVSVAAIVKIEQGHGNPNVRTLDALGDGIGIESWRLLRWARKHATNVVTAEDNPINPEATVQ